MTFSLINKCPLCLKIYFPQGNAVLAGDAGAVFVFRREDRRASILPAEFALNGSPGSLDGAGTPLKLVPHDGIAADTERGRLTKSGVFPSRQVRLRREHRE